MSSLLKFAQQRDWIADNPLTKIPQRRVRRRRGYAVTFSAEQAANLMAFVEEHYPMGMEGNATGQPALSGWGKIFGCGWTDVCRRGNLVDASQKRLRHAGSRLHFVAGL